MKGEVEKKICNMLQNSVRGSVAANLISHGAGADVSEAAVATFVEVQVQELVGKVATDSHWFCIALF